MRIVSNGDMLTAYTPAFRIEWTKGTHTAHVCGYSGVLDVFTFAWEKNEASMLDFTSALDSYLSYMEAS